MKITLKNGLTMEGTGKELLEVIKKLDVELDESLYYRSEKSGLMLISEMHPLHIKNAICKAYRNWAEQLNKVTDNKEFLLKMRNGPEGETMLALIAELVKKSGEIL
jgi:phosphoenolpyruvate synthase/pyruvate phosphate dikinase